jgi:hypothetical protein
MRPLLFTLLALSLSATEFDGYWIEVVATAYSPQDPIDHHYRETKGERWRWITADGRTDVRQVPYGVAVPLNGRKPWLPFGTRLLIPVGDGYVDQSRPDRVFRVDDVGNGKEYFKHDRDGRLHVDLRFKTHKSAIAWAGPTGRRVLRVFVITGERPAPKALGPEDDLFWPPTRAATDPR